MRAHEFSLSADGRVLLTCSQNDMAAQLWNPSTGRPIGMPLDHGDEVSAVAVSPDGRLAATTTLIDRSMRPGPANNLVRLWSTTTFLPVGPPLRWNERGSGIGFSADGATLRHYHSANRGDEVWTMPRPLDGDVERVERVVQSLTGMLLEESGVIRPLTADEWRARRSESAK